MTVVIGQPESSTFSGLGIKNNISRIKKSINSKLTCNTGTTELTEVMSINYHSSSLGHGCYRTVSAAIALKTR